MDRIIDRFGPLEKSNVRFHNPPYIRGYHFPKKEIAKIVKLINKERVDYLWMGLGNPKKEIMLKDIFHKANFSFAFPVGAAFDFMSGAKKQAPKPMRTLGLEWFFRFITDFRYSKNKVGGSFTSLSMLNRHVVFRD
jgi:N-acetylglucosaminyldiphosphoundecaprenol N-acetyl-beta-D-mannosaminyltransferase